MASPFEPKQPLPYQAQGGQPHRDGEQPDGSARDEAQAEMEVLLAAERGCPDKSEEAIIAQINTATSPTASKTKKHAARVALMSEAGKSATKD